MGYYIATDEDILDYWFEKKNLSDATRNSYPRIKRYLDNNDLDGYIPNRNKYTNLKNIL